MARKTEILSGEASTTIDVVDAATEMAKIANVGKVALDVLAAQELRRGETARRALLKIYRAEKKVPIYLSPMYRPYLGNVMIVSINGITIRFKVDGTSQEVPETFADEIISRRMKIDAMLMKQDRMADVKANLETSPGELQLI